MTDSTQRGFTIIEVMLYLGVAGLLLASMMTGISVAIERQRFSDSANSTQGFLQQQFNETQNTLNDRAAGVCDISGGGVTPTNRGASKCLVVGKLIDFGVAGASDSTIKVHNVLINATLPDNYATFAGGDLGLFRSIGPSGLNTTAVLSDANDSAFTVPWGAQLPQLTIGSSPLASDDIRYIGLLRSPISGSIGLYYLDGFLSDLAPSQAIGNTLTPFAPGTAARTCINSADITTAKALLKISIVGSQDAVTTHFDSDAERISWCP